MVPRTAPSVLLLALLAAGCAGGGGATARRPDEGAKPAPVADARMVRASELTPRDQERFRRAWALFVAHDPGWSAARDEWLATGGAAPYILSENLFRYFWSASKAHRRDEVARVGNEARHVGEPAVAYFLKALVTDRWPLQEPLTVEVFNPDDPKHPIKKTFTHYDIDDVTRQHAAYVLAGIGAPAVPALSSPRVLDAPVASARRYGAYALGAIGTDEAIAALARMAREKTDWQDRGAAVKGLGFALRKNPAARPPLEQALQDPDDFVRRKAQEGLSGETKIEF